MGITVAVRCDATGPEAGEPPKDRPPPAIAEKEDPLPQGAVRRFKSRIPHDAFRAIAFSHDSKTVAVAGDLGVHVWDIAGGPERRYFPGIPRLYNLAFAGDSNTLVGASMDGCVEAWDINSGRRVRRFLEPQPNRIGGFAVSPDGKAIITVGSETASVRLLNFSNGEELANRPTLDTKAYISGMCFSPDGRFVSSGFSDGQVRLWDAATGKLSQTIKRTGDAEADVGAVLWSSDGRLIVCAGQTQKPHGGDPESHDRAKQLDYQLTCRVREVASGKEIITIQDERINRPAFSPDGRWLAFILCCDNAVPFGV